MRFRKPSEVVADMENELAAIRKQVEKLKTLEGINKIDTYVKKEIQVLFKMTSGKYTFEKE